MIGADTNRTLGSWIILHRLHEATENAIDKINLIGHIKFRIDTQSPLDLVLDELPPEELEATHDSDLIQ